MPEEGPTRTRRTRRAAPVPRDAPPLVDHNPLGGFDPALMARVDADPHILATVLLEIGALKQADTLRATQYKELKEEVRGVKSDIQGIKADIGGIKLGVAKFIAALPAIKKVVRFVDEEQHQRRAAESLQAANSRRMNQYMALCLPLLVTILALLLGNALQGTGSLSTPTRWALLAGALVVVGVAFFFAVTHAVPATPPTPVAAGTVAVTASGVTEDEADDEDDDAAA